MSTKPGLRELKKRATRQHISDVATRLFVEHGFEEVTLAEVADAAGVAKMTVSNYFPRKEDMVLDLHEELVSVLARTVTGRPGGMDILPALRQAYLVGLERREASLGFSGRPFVKMVTESHLLTTRLWEIDRQRESALAAALADALEAPVDDIAVRFAAAEITTAHRILFEHVFARVLAGYTHDQISAELVILANRVFDMLDVPLARTLER